MMASEGLKINTDFKRASNPKGDYQVKFQLDNDLDTTIYQHWIDFEGAIMDPTAIPPKTSTAGLTGNTHCFLYKHEDGTEIACVQFLRDGSCYTASTLIALAAEAAQAQANKVGDGPPFRIALGRVSRNDVPDSQAVDFIVQNDIGENILQFWIDSLGGFCEPSTIAPGSQGGGRTSSGHAYLYTKENGTEIACISFLKSGTYQVSDLQALADADAEMTCQEKHRFQIVSAKMIPLRNHTPRVYRKNDFWVTLSGSAILGDQPYEIHFDTGSWQTCIPWGSINRSNVTVLQENVKDCWGKPADKVQGQLALVSADGETVYTVDNYVFYARKNADGADAPCDRGEDWGNSIMGGFPSVLNADDQSLVHAIAVKYSEVDKLGYGIVSIPLEGSIEDNYENNLKCYIQIGATPEVTECLIWQSIIPQCRGPDCFSPEYVPGFKITLKFPDGEVPDIVVSGIDATVDTGAPNLTMRLGPKNPHRDDMYSHFFHDNGPGWMSGQYKQDSRILSPGVRVVVQFTGDNGERSRYEFLSTDDFRPGHPSHPPPTQVIVGDFDGMVPWHIGNQTTRIRINLGNSIYYFCDVFFWDIAHKRVGLRFATA